MLILMLFVPQINIIFAISTSNNPIIKKIYAWERWRTSAWYLPILCPCPQKKFHPQIFVSTFLCHTFLHLTFLCILKISSCSLVSTNFCICILYPNINCHSSFAKLYLHIFICITLSANIHPQIVHPPAADCHQPFLVVCSILSVSIITHLLLTATAPITTYHQQPAECRPLPLPINACLQPVITGSLLPTVNACHCQLVACCHHPSPPICGPLSTAITACLVLAAHHRSSLSVFCLLTVTAAHQFEPDAHCHWQPAQW